MGTETKWTPGPWCVDEANRTLVARLVDEKYEYICSVDPEEFSFSDTTDEENRANATLIAEAPALYKELEALTGVVQSDPFLRYSEDSLYGKAIKAALAVLKKARGE